jgi:hypothetical protein
MEVQSDGRVRLDGVLVDIDKRTLTIPVEINSRTSPGLQEYALVHQSGKTHESILVTTNAAFVIHTAALLVGLDMKAPTNSSRLPSDRLTREQIQGSAKKGVPVAISLVASQGKATQTIPLESLVAGVGSTRAMESGRWIYTGSEFVPAGFSAQLTGSLVSLVSDRSALISYSGTGHDDDKNWQINTNRLPASGSKLNLVLAFPPKSATGTPARN